MNAHSFVWLAISFALTGFAIIEIITMLSNLRVMRADISSRKAFADCLDLERKALLRCVQTSERTNKLLDDVMTVRGRSPTVEEWEALARAIDDYDLGERAEGPSDELLAVWRARAIAVVKAARACLGAHIVDLRKRTQSRESVQ